jgi:hypothetical protein
MLVIVHQIVLLAIVGTIALTVPILKHRAAKRARARDEALDVGAWIEDHTFDSDTAPEIVDRLRGRSLGELRSTVADRAYKKGWMAAEAEAHRRRSEAAGSRRARAR